MTTKEKDEILDQISTLRTQCTGNMLDDFDKEERIRALQRRIDAEEQPLPDRPKDSDIECVGCGS